MKKFGSESNIEFMSCINKSKKTRQQKDSSSKSIFCQTIHIKANDLCSFQENQISK